MLDSFDQGFSHARVAVRAVDESISESRPPANNFKRNPESRERLPGFAFTRVQDAGERLAGVSTRRKSCHQSVPASLNDRDGTRERVDPAWASRLAAMFPEKGMKDHLRTKGAALSSAFLNPSRAVKIRPQGLSRPITTNPSKVGVLRAGIGRKSGNATSQSNLLTLQLGLPLTG